MTLVVPASVFDAVRAAAAAGYPAEACGFLVGLRAGNDLGVERVVPAENARGADAARTRYRIDPRRWRAVERAADRDGREVLGIWHSHPDAPARPSLYDLDHAWPSIAYLIVAVDDGRPADATAWRLADDRGRFDPVALAVEPDRPDLPRERERNRPCPTS